MLVCCSVVWINAFKHIKFCCLFSVALSEVLIFRKHREMDLTITYKSTSDVKAYNEEKLKLLTNINELTDMNKAKQDSVTDAKNDNCDANAEKDQDEKIHNSSSREQEEGTEMAAAGSDRFVLAWNNYKYTVFSFLNSLPPLMLNVHINPS